jgi:UDP-N-acetylmuramoylalanine--D-glutamate ligase
MDLSKIENFQDSVVTVMGLGRYKQGSGLGAAKWLIRHGAQTIITDLKDEQELEESMNLVMEWYEKYREIYKDRSIYQPIFVLGEHRKEDFTDVDCVVQNPGVPSESEFINAAREKGVHIESDTSLFFRFCPYPIVAVTGTKGKTTTTKLIGEIMRKADDSALIAGNINVSPLEQLDEILKRGEPTLIVLELSSWMLDGLPDTFEQLKKGPDISVLTNVYPDHLNRYHSYGDYIHSKEIIFEYQTQSQFTVLNYDHQTVRDMGVEVKGKLFWCSREFLDMDGCYLRDDKVVFVRENVVEEILPLSEVALKGEHNIENILTAVCASKLRNVPVDAIRTTLKEFAGVADRQELVREVDERTYINDTTATNPDAVIAALNRFGNDGDIVLIAGGQDKKMEYENLAETIIKTCKHVVLFDGDASDILEKLIAGRVPVERGVKSMQDAVNKAKQASASGDIVLLSPAAASFNMFLNEFDRGEQFREAVRNL